ncbi:MAG: hypothetical protein ACR2HX_23540 [Pyrinomonadaceae bacterium]
MKSRMNKVNKLAGCVAAGVFAISLASSTLAQGPPAGAGPPADNNPKSIDRARQMDQGRLRRAELGAVAKTENDKHVQAAVVNVKADFARIQVLRNDIARNLVARKPLDYNLIAVQTAEIHKRANRLNVYMSAHAPDDKEQSNPSDVKSEEMIEALVKLCQLIDSFTENPSLKNAAMVDAKEVQKAKEDKARADRDLRAILKLSENLQKKADSLKAPK